MKRVIETGLPEFGRPVEWATIGGGLLCTAAVPMKSDGSYETGEPRAQIELALSNLEKVVAAAGGQLADVLQIMVFLTGAEHIPTLNEVWAEHFDPPHPNRAVVIVAAIGVPDIVIMMQVHANIGP